jgi:hypothetical protein
VVVVVVVVVLLIFHQNTDQNRRGAAGECKKRHPNPPQIGELSAIISQQASRGAFFGGESSKTPYCTFYQVRFVEQIKSPKTQSRFFPRFCITAFLGISRKGEFGSSHIAIFYTGPLWS